MQALIGLIDLGEDNVELVVAFRGSEKKACDWMTNFTIALTSVDTLVPKGKNHSSWQVRLFCSYLAVPDYDCGQRQ
jgi:hypothetical protein